MKIFSDIKTKAILTKYGMVPRIVFDHYPNKGPAGEVRVGIGSKNLDRVTDEDIYVYANLETDDYGFSANWNLDSNQFTFTYPDPGKKEDKVEYFDVDNLSAWKAKFYNILKDLAPEATMFAQRVIGYFEKTAHDMRQVQKRQKKVAKKN